MSNLSPPTWRLADFTEVLQNRPPQPIDCEQFFAVLVPLIEQAGEWHLLYEVRADALQRQPGQVCFPGGEMEPGERPADCAVRETCEELNLSPSAIELIGPLDYLHTYSNFTMYPYLGVLRPAGGQPIVPNPAEVKECFLVPFRFLVETEPLLYQCDVLPQVADDFPYAAINATPDYRWRKGVTQIPIYRYGGHPIWGLTAQITRRLVEIVLKTPGAGQCRSGIACCEGVNL